MPGLVGQLALTDPLTTGIRGHEDLAAMTAATKALFVFGYPVSIVVIARWIPVVRQRRTTWFVVHQAAVASIVAGWAIEGQLRSVIINGSWFVVAAVWYVAAGRRPGSA